MKLSVILPTYNEKDAIIPLISEILVILGKEGIDHELVIVDEVHTCARPTGASTSQQQRYHLISRIARKPNQQMILLTATPHSGKPEEFHSLLGLLKDAAEKYLKRLK